MSEQTTPPMQPTGPATFGRVAEDGTVYVRVGDTEHEVGQYPEGTPEEALAFFTRRYESVAFEVQLLEQRIHKGALSPDEALSSIDQMVASLATPHCVGDIIALVARLDALRPLISQQREQRREDKVRRTEDAKARKEQIVAAAEKVAGGRDWRNGANRLRDLLTEWKALPRIDRASDDALWHRFSAARTAYTKARKAHFAQLDESREAARGVKERLVKEAEAIADSTDWGATSARYRTLMQQWKAAGPAPRGVEDQLWQRFRAAQDTFFGARDAANAAQDEEFRANAEKKRALLVEAEALLPVRDLDAAKRAFRDLAERWDAAGKVPRDQINDLEGRIRKIEQAIRGVEDDQWRRSDPEKSARADDMVGKLRDAIAALESDLASARAAGDQSRISALESDLASRRSFLEMAERAAAEFGG
ncbi:DUF349 domain-containing protein [Nocardioides terrisoli]|uniref:DUF349 domain-containing protein n=1 Tax=Nocardioides terrisoli TaxID=3388267 RepID=UPI00287B7D1A|nr:DUF349 domain-containing protein [Nocardioides marmorisolisilvae]